jgi:hypothetical protein
MMTHMGSAARAMTFASTWGAALGFVLTLGCAAGPARPPQRQDTIAILSPRCAGLSSCLIGHVTTVAAAAPIAQAAVFLIRELEAGEPEPVRFFALTDEQGVFVVEQPPPGRYRISVYKDDRSVEVTGMLLGAPGTTVLPVRLGSD